MFRRLFGWFMGEEEENKARRTVQGLMDVSMKAAKRYGTDVRFWNVEQMTSYVQDITEVNNKIKRRRR